MKRYLHATHRGEVAHAADQVQAKYGYLRADKGAEKVYDRVIELDLSSVEPHISRFQSAAHREYQPCRRTIHA